MVLHDLVRKVMGVPVGVLLGGLHKSRVMVADEIAGGAPDGIARECVAFMDKGVRAANVHGQARARR